MENLKDTKEIMKQLHQLKEANMKTLEGLSAVQLLMVDDNNGRVKDRNLSAQLEGLARQITEVGNQIEVFSNQLQKQ